MNSGKVDVKVSMSHSRTFRDWTDLRLAMLGPVHALGNRRFSWSRVRRVLGQERGLRPSLVLHGLRDLQQSPASVNLLQIF